MFTASEVDVIIEQMKEIQGTRKKTLVKIWGFFLVLVIVLVVLFLIVFPNQFQSVDTSWILPVYGGIAFLITLIGFIVSRYYVSEKPFFEFLYKEIYNKINVDQDSNLTYNSYIKGNDYNKRGGLFTSWANVMSKRHIHGSTDNQLHFDIYDCIMTTSNGKNQQTHFAGIYFVIHKDFNTSIQVRSNGSPKRKGVKFIKQEVSEVLKVYKQENDELSNIDYSLLRYVERINENDLYKRVYLGTIDNELHLAVWYKKHPLRKQKILDKDTLNSIYNQFIDELNVIEEISNIDAY